MLERKNIAFLPISFLISLFAISIPASADNHGHDPSRHREQRDHQWRRPQLQLQRDRFQSLSKPGFYLYWPNEPGCIYND
jgi:hypothetical protein